MDDYNDYIEYMLATGDDQFNNSSDGNSCRWIIIALIIIAVLWIIGNL